jgi:hypothetical protein
MRENPLRVFGEACMAQGTKDRQLELVGPGRTQFAGRKGEQRIHVHKRTNVKSILALLLLKVYIVNS